MNVYAMRYRQQRGVALLVVLWACTLLAILLGGYATASRLEATQVRYQLAQTQVRYLAEAGVMRAIYESAQNVGALGKPATGPFWIADGRLYTLRIDDTDIQIRVSDETGKVDLNTATPDVLQGLFQAAGVDAGSAAALVANLVESRDAQRLNNQTYGNQRYKQAGLNHGPRYAEFASLEDLQAVLGMTPAIYQKVEPAITLWSRRPQPTPLLAPALALSALPGMDMNKAQRFIAVREATQPPAPPPVLPNGMPAGNWRGGNVKTIYATASTADGMRSALQVTVRFDALRPGQKKVGTPYTILRWQDDVGR
ncbi:general secretion pathway protein GspK [Dyella silvatica]|uniref:general secretion pathway protein GspK n=1 Tax=Dyella silvatica TaxID=2992128 RepID=UPI002252327F|nr:type II secretion system protein GspK [Dyella silvatica]